MFNIFLTLILLTCATILSKFSASVAVYGFWLIKTIRTLITFVNFIDFNFFLLFSFVYILYNIASAQMYIKKSLHLYTYLCFLIIFFNFMGFNSFLGFLILIELTTVTFIVILIFNFSNFFLYQTKFRQFNFVIFIFVLIFFNKEYGRIIPASTEFFSYYLLYLYPIWNDFIGIYLYIYFDNSLFIIIIGLVFFLLTVGLVYVLKLIFFKKIFNLFYLKIKFLQTLQSYYVDFFSKYNFWESMEKATINKFHK